MLTIESRHMVKYNHQTSNNCHCFSSRVSDGECNHEYKNKQNT